MRHPVRLPHHTVMTQQIENKSGPWLNVGTPRDAKSAAALARYNERAPIPLVLSAILPLVVAPQPGNPVSVAIGVLSWLVFVIDFVVHERLLQRYLSTRLGKFDLLIVLLTAPWFLLPGTPPGGGIIVILRLARLARLVVASKRARQLFDRIGRVAVVAVSVMTAGAVVAYYAEHPVNPEFATFGDSLWWAIVTLTTVGYGDIVPVTTTGRIASVMIMLTGVAVLGLLAGTLASFFRLQPPGTSPTGTADPGATAATGPPETTPEIDSTSSDGLDRVLTELTELRAQVAELTDMKTQLAMLTAHLGPPAPNNAATDTTTG